MGKNLKGKECGKGICQRKDGRYYVRYESKTGGLLEKYFRSLPDARNWLEEVKYKEKHGTHIYKVCDENGIARFCVNLE